MSYLIGPDAAGIAPPWEEVFNKPPLSTCTAECPPAWRGNRISVMLADEECERLRDNCCMYDPPITEEEIEKYAKRFKMTKRQAESQIREGREAHDGYNQKQAA